jgi:hypothetical protein
MLLLLWDLDIPQMTGHIVSGLFPVESAIKRLPFLCYSSAFHSLSDPRHRYLRKDMNPPDSVFRPSPIYFCEFATKGRCFVSES